VHAAAVAEELGMRQILVPQRPGAFSALGLLCTDVLHDYVRSDLSPLFAVEPAHAARMFGALEARAEADLAAEGLDPAQAVFERELDLRYAGQGYELRVPLAEHGRGALDAATLAATRAAFDAQHARIHGHAAAEKPVELVSYRLRVRVAVPKYQPRPDAAGATAPPPADAGKGTRAVHLTAHPANAVVYERDRLPVGAAFAGPAIVEQFDATTIVPPGWSARVDVFRNLVLRRGARP
jgi:N-methylhydantoinase A